MPRDRRGRETAPVIPSNSLVASAVRYPGKAARIYNPTGEWQRECYRHYTICGEAAFAANFYGHAISRATLYAATLDANGDEIEQTSGTAKGYLDELCYGADGQEEMLNSIGIHLCVAGECYLVGRKVQSDDLRGDLDTIWEIVSVLEMQVRGRQWSIRYGDAQKEIVLDDNDVVIRIWLQNPAKRVEAFSPFRPLLPVLTEIEYLTKHVFAQVQSRLAGAGVWPLPQGITFPSPPTQEGETPAYNNEAEGFTLTLGNAMLTPLKDPSSPSALVPVIIQVPDDAVDKIRDPIYFWSPLDAEARSLRQEAITRFALGMDLPPEMVLGMGSNSGTGGGRSNGVSHWGAWQIEESTIKLHIEPMLDTIVNALTIGYLRPLDGAKPTDVICYDSSALRLRPDRSREALEMYDRGAISLATLLRENGFEDQDAPDDDEYALWLTKKIASGSATPEMVAAAAGDLGVDLPIPPPTEAPAMPNEAPPIPTLEDHPTRDLPDQGYSLALLVACDALVYRALERAGNRLRAGGSKPPGVASFEIHTLAPIPQSKAPALLDDAWPCAAQVLDGVADPAKVIPVLDAYATHLLVTGAKHSKSGLGQWLGAIDQQEAS